MYSFFELSLITVLFKSISKTKFLRTELLILVFVCVCVCEREREREREREGVCVHAHINQKHKVDPGLSSQTKRRFHKLDYHSLSGYPNELREGRHRKSGKNTFPFL